MKISFFLTFILLLVFTFFGQKAPKDLQKLVGTWKYSQGSGYEIWTKENNVFIGKGMVLTKANDPVFVERQVISMKGDLLHYTTASISESKGSEKNYVSKGKKLVFINQKNDLPLSITYKFRCWSKNTLFIKIKHTEKSKEVVLKLKRVN